VITSLRRCPTRVGLAALVACTVISLATSAGATQSSGRSGPVASVGVERTTLASLCSLVQSVRHLNVRRGHVFNHEIFSFRANVSSSNAKEIRAIGRELCALPLLPRGLQCTVDLGISYTLTFVVGLGSHSAAVKPVTVDPGGCQEVYGLGATRWSVPAPQFWRLLGTALGMPRATSATFAGAISNG
jgi:hypothetical protein